MILKGGIIYTMEGDKPFVGDIRVQGGIIEEIDDQLIPTIDEEVFDCDGMLVFPGFIDPHTHLGVVEEGIGAEGADHNERNNPVTPTMKGYDGANPYDDCFRQSIENGVTSAGIGPGSANVISGEFSYIKLKGRNISDMIVKESIGMKCAFGENPKTVYGKSGKSPLTRMGIAAELRSILFKTVEYKEKKEKHIEEKGSDLLFEKDMSLESMIPVIEKKIPLKAHAHRADDILTAIRIAKEFDINMTLDHCSEGHFIPEFIAESGFPAIVGPTLGHRGKYETRNKTFATPGVLNDHGVLVSITTDHPVIPLRELRICAAYAAKYGMGKMEALKTITINAAKILGVDDTTGSLKVGKSADIVVWDSHPFDIFSSPALVLIDGEKAYINQNN